MFLSFNLRKSSKYIFLSAFIIILGAAIFISPVKSVLTFAASGEKLPFLKADTEEKRQQLLSSLGWKVKEVYSKEAVIIPKEFDETYFKYNEIQRSQGLNLKRQRGKMADKYTYIIENYPGDLENVRLTLLLRKGKVIGGDVCSLGRDGFMHNLFYPERNEGVEK